MNIYCNAIDFSQDRFNCIMRVRAVIMLAAVLLFTMQVATAQETVHVADEPPEVAPELSRNGISTPPKFRVSFSLNATTDMSPLTVTWAPLAI